MKKIFLTLCIATIAIFTARAEKVEYKVSKNVPVDTFVIKNKVLVKDTKKIGIDYWPSSYQHWSKAIFNNLWNRFGAFEPRILVNWGYVEKGGKNSFVCDKGFGLSGWNKWKSGYWDGAEVHVFGLTNGQFKLKRKSKLVKSVAGKNVVDTYTLEDDGGAALEAGDWIWMKKIYLKPSPHQQIRNLKTGKKWNKNGIDNFAKTVSMIGNPKWELVMKPCPEGGSTSAMKITTTGKGGFYTFHTGANDDRFHKWPEGEFHWEGWLKRNKPGKVKIDFGGLITKTFDVGKKWKKYQFDFNPAEAFKSYKRKGSPQYSITVPDSCELFLDNIMIYQKGIEPFATYPEIIEKLDEFKPGMIRFANMVSTRSVDVAFSKGINQKQEQDATRGGYSPTFNPMTAVDCLELTKKLKSNPWLIVPGMMSLDDCDKIMEFLAGPADKGFGKRRAFYNHKNPWTDEFDVIYIEIGNEQWGSNFSHCFNRKPEDYARLADMLIRRMKASPYYNPDKFKFICNGWSRANERTGWSAKVARNCPAADIIDDAFYFGGWDGVTLKSEDSSSLYQSRMLYSPHIVEKDIIESLCNDPELYKKMAKILSENPSLQNDVLEYIISDNGTYWKTPFIEILETILEAKPGTDLDSLRRTLNLRISALFDREIAKKATEKFAAVFAENETERTKFLKNIAEKNAFKNEADEISNYLISSLKNELAACKNKIPKDKKSIKKLEKLILNEKIVNDKGVQLFALNAIKTLLANNPNPLNKLAQNPIFIESVRKRIMNLFGDKVTEAIKADNLIAEKILIKYDKLPKNPDSGNKEKANYEAGPGYSLPGPGKKPAEEEEMFGKSLALGISTLDAFMYELERKFGFQCYFKFGFGNYWSSHVDSDSWRRNPSYEALLMVNKYCNGNLMEVDSSNVKRINIPKMKISHIDNHGRAHHNEISGRKNVPLTKCYAFQDGKKHSFLLFNRSFKESRKVKLELPYTPDSKAVLHKLTAKSPMDTNRKELKVKQLKKVINDFKNGYEITLRPGEILIINNEESDGLMD